MGKRVVILGALLLLASATSGLGRWGSGAVIGKRHLREAERGTFVSLWPACACGNSTVLERFSIKDGRPLGLVAKLRSRFPVAVGAPHADGHRRLWLTFSSGPKCSNGTAGCGPVEDSCRGKVVRFDPASRSSTTVLSFPSSQAVIDAAPSPDGERVALVTADCAHSFFNYHLVVDDLRTGREWALGADAAPCHSLFRAAWSRDRSQLVFPYGPSTLPPSSHLQPNGTCSAPRRSGLVVASAARASGSASWRLIPADRGCGYEAATFDPWGIAAIEGCAGGAPLRTPGGLDLGNAYLVQLNRSHREVQRLELAPGYDGGDVAFDPLNHVTLVSEYQAANQGTPVFNWVWAFDGRHLRVVDRYPNRDAATVIAEPW